MFLTLCVSAAGYIEEINCLGTIYLAKGDVYDLKKNISIYPADDDLKNSLNYYTRDTDVVSLNLANNRCKITAKNYGRADIVISSPDCTEIITVDVSLIGGEF